MADLATHILITFCNLTPGAPALGLLDVGADSLAVLHTPPDLAAQGGATGIAVAGDFIFVATSRVAGTRTAGLADGPSSLFAFDRRDLSLAASHVCGSVYDAHSIVVDEDGHLLIVSSGTDAIVRLTLDGPTVRREEVVWRPEPSGPEQDRHHLNALAYWQGRLVVSGFGLKSGATWSTAANGFIYDLTTGRTLIDSIGQPHALVDLGESLAYCESATSEVALFDTNRRQRLGGYTRGSCRIGGSLFVATSRGRRSSKSTHLLTSRSEPGALSGQCAIYRLDAADLRIEAITDLNRYGWEIYDLLPVSATASWPVASEVAWRDNLIAALREGLDERDVVESRLHIEIGERDRQVAWLHDEVAERDRTIAWLHGEVADRDRQVAELRSGTPAKP